ncbi:hypothetical protein SDC9_200417 [bioreactor metagenome]|uniref:Uncharacterized protein n=1 Tax=bioreactor metagenome TaxID=1076179 RepID=A0A645IN37_9ZZZZ
MPDAAVAVDLLEPADVGHDHAAQIAFDDDFGLQHHRNRSDVFVGQVFGAKVGRNIELGDDLLGDRRPDPIEIAQGELDLFITRDVNPNDAWHIA